MSYDFLRMPMIHLIKFIELAKNGFFVPLGVAFLSFPTSGSTLPVEYFLKISPLKCLFREN
jgi:hypothetical protein